MAYNVWQTRVTVSVKAWEEVEIKDVSCKSGNSEHSWVNSYLPIWFRKIVLDFLGSLSGQERIVIRCFSKISSFIVAVVVQFFPMWIWQYFLCIHDYILDVNLKCKALLLLSLNFLGSLSGQERVVNIISCVIVFQLFFNVNLRVLPVCNDYTQDIIIVKLYQINSQQ